MHSEANLGSASIYVSAVRKILLKPDKFSAMMKTVILAGGFGKRLKPLTDTRPKPMIQVSGFPIIEWQIKWLRKFGMKEFILCVGFMKEQIINYIGNGARFNCRVEYSVEEKPLGTGGALLNARELLSNEGSFFMLNGDILTDLEPNRLQLTDSNTIGLVPLKSPYGVVQLDNNSRVLGFVEKPEIPNYWINAGIYRFTKEVFQYLPENGNIEVTALPTLAQQGKLRAIRYEQVFWRSIDSHKDIEEASKELQAARMS
jgi:mannose-1-phosphate guanylyltransferase